MTKEMRIYFVTCVLTVSVFTNCYAVKKDPLLPGNRRLDMHESACKERKGAKDTMDLFTCQEFTCGDGSTVPVPRGTPCKLIMEFGHCLNGTCLSASDYLDAMKSTTESPQTTQA